MPKRGILLRIRGSQAILEETEQLGEWRGPQCYTGQFDSLRQGYLGQSLELG